MHESGARAAKKSLTGIGTTCSRRSSPERAGRVGGWRCPFWLRRKDIELLALSKWNRLEKRIESVLLRSLPPHFPVKRQKTIWRCPCDGWEDPMRACSAIRGGRMRKEEGVVSSHHMNESILSREKMRFATNHFLVLRSSLDGSQAYTYSEGRNQEH